MRSAATADVAHDGMIARLLDLAFENPAMSGGLVVMALTAMAIVSNALFLQAGHHPEPLFATRPETATLAPPLAEVPLPRIPASRALKPPTPSAAPTAPDAGDPDATLVADVQRELARLGLYTGAIDGIPGARTEAAIAAYQAAAGLEATGAASPALLELMQDPLPPAEGPLAVLTSPATEANVATTPGGTEAAAEQLCRVVQTALNEIGYGPIAVDGHVGAETSNAISRFELDNGLPITGDIGDRVVQRLVAIGALQAI